MFFDQLSGPASKGMTTCRRLEWSLQTLFPRGEFGKIAEIDARKFGEKQNRYTNLDLRLNFRRSRGPNARTQHVGSLIGSIEAAL